MATSKIQSSTPQIDWSSKTLINKTDTRFTAPKNGVLVGTVSTWNNNGPKFNINGALVIHAQHNGNYTTATEFPIMFPINAGDVLTVTNGDQWYGGDLNYYSYK